MSKINQWLEPQVIRKGDGTGAGMVLKYTTINDATLYAVGVPLVDWRNPLGPTWSYVLSNHNGITLIDTGVPGSLPKLEDGLHQLDISLSDVKKIVITHGHMDHDGTAPLINKKVGAKIVAHEIYSNLLNANLYRGERRPGQHSEHWDQQSQAFFDSIMQLEQLKREMKVAQAVKEGDKVDEMTFYYAPGHSPDELCILFDDILFTGDHVLPMITPHPTLAHMYDRAKPYLNHHHDELDGNKYYGLKVYLSALKKVNRMRKDLLCLPAHRLYFDDKLHMFGVERADQIIHHHVERFAKILSLCREPQSIEQTLPHLFQERHLKGRGWGMAVSEVQAHLELLKEAGDVELIGEGGDEWMTNEGAKQIIRSTGTENFLKLIEELPPYETTAPLP